MLETEYAGVVKMEIQRALAKPIQCNYCSRLTKGIIRIKCHSGVGWICAPCFRGYMQFNSKELFIKGPCDPHSKFLFDRKGSFNYLDILDTKKDGDYRIANFIYYDLEAFLKCAERH